MTLKNNHTFHFAYVFKCKDEGGVWAPQLLQPAPPGEVTVCGPLAQTINLRYSLLHALQWSHVPAGYTGRNGFTQQDHA